MLNLAKNNDPKVGDVFAGFSKFGRYLGVFWFFFLIVLLGYLPGLAGVGIGLAIRDPDVTPIVMIGGLLVSLVVVIVIMLRYFFAWYIVADNWEDDSVITAFKKSAMITEGNRLKLFGSMIVLGIFAQIGILLLGVGLLITMPIANIAFASIYSQLKESAGAGASAA